jgi:FKBP-type peptidyl-prolyl cis-trans isomerase FkpA
MLYHPSMRSIFPAASISRVAALATILACATGCSDNPYPPGEVIVPMIEETAFAPALGVDLAAMTKTSTGLYYRDFVTGSGVAAASGKKVSVFYTGQLPDGTQFDSRQSPQTPFEFTLGRQEVIAGWDEGVAGMLVGGRRQLIVPPALGYGASSVGSIPRNSILVFTVELRNVQ